MTHEYRSDEALEVAGLIASETFYPRLADTVAMTIRYCALYATPLDDEQATALYRATFESGDGVMDAIAQQIDLYAVRQIEREGLA